MLSPACSCERGRKEWKEGKIKGLPEVMSRGPINPLYISFAFSILFSSLLQMRVRIFRTPTMRHEGEEQGGRLFFFSPHLSQFSQCLRMMLKSPHHLAPLTYGLEGMTWPPRTDHPPDVPLDYLTLAHGERSPLEFVSSPQTLGTRRRPWPSHFIPRRCSNTRTTKGVPECPLFAPAKRRRGEKEGRAGVYYATQSEPRRRRATLSKSKDTYMPQCVACSVITQHMTA